MRVGARAWTIAGLSGLLLSTTACDLLGGKKTGEAETKTASAEGVSEADKRLCASNATYRRLKESTFDEAKRVREQDTERLDALAEASVVRMERPLLESRDEALGLTVCSGRMILELPPGAGAAFGGFGHGLEVEGCADQPAGHLERISLPVQRGFTDSVVLGVVAQGVKPTL